jgi:hypothetical protein
VRRSRPTNESNDNVLEKYRVSVPELFHAVICKPHYYTGKGSRTVWNFFGVRLFNVSSMHRRRLVH